MVHPCTRALACSFVLAVSAACSVRNGTQSSGETGDGSTGDGDGDGDPGVPIEAVSLLLVVDNSGSMTQPQRVLAMRAHELIAPLDAVGIPWRLGITTTDDGNPWCDDSTPESGNLVLSSCLDRLTDFSFGEFYAEDYNCRDFCSTDNIATLPTTTALDSNSTPRPWIESNGSETNLDGVTVEEALPCVVSQGFFGCGFESQLDSARLTIGRSADVEQDEYGFVEPGRLLVIVFVTDEADCSRNPEWEEIFLPANTTFWSDPQAMYPTSAVCWNAGMQCTGDPSGYDDCVTVDLDADGNPTDDPDLAVLRPVDRIIDVMGNPEHIRVFGIVGVNGSGEPDYADVGEMDPAYQDWFGIGPGCTAPPPMGSTEPVTAVPPGRIWTVLEQLGPSSGRRAWSICSDDFDGGLTAIGEAIAAEF